ncbi:integrase/recombinase (plasmid) [Cupriavidus sp. KK10]|uniref:integrase/recombinase n=1 Tax=Cupriavidus sp. KK10 TaxID=1478019 RepID=UPI001BA54BD7|nr:integrase/recombinase [Cupriavidus sp. KK10]QUN32082.1 integrase/recombinase [Cupriavidus sp. KK10]
MAAPLPSPLERLQLPPALSGAAGSKKLGRGHRDWRPFAGPLSPASVRHALVILNALFAWLTEAGNLAGNPLALARRRRAPNRPRITRYLSHDLWDAVKETVAAMPVATERERLYPARCRWVLTVLYPGGLRAAEVTGTPMGTFWTRTSGVLHFSTHLLRQSLFSHRVELGAAFNGIVFFQSHLQTPLSTYSSLDQYARQYVESVSARSGQTADEKVRQMIVALMPSGECSLARIAGLLGVDVRTIRRRLGARRTTSF